MVSSITIMSARPMARVARMTTSGSWNSHSPASSGMVHRMICCTEKDIASPGLDARTTVANIMTMSIA